MTKMNYRLRFSALKSNHIRKYGENDPVGIHTHSQCVNCHMQCDSLPGYHKILRSNYTFYLLDKLDLTPEQANEHKLNLISSYKKHSTFSSKTSAGYPSPCWPSQENALRGPPWPLSRRCRRVSRPGWCYLRPFRCECVPAVVPSSVPRPCAHPRITDGSCGATLIGHDRGPNDARGGHRRRRVPVGDAAWPLLFPGARRRLRHVLCLERSTELLSHEQR